VRLNIEQEVSSIAPTNSQTAQAADLITNKRAINTKVVAMNGQTIVLGGLIEDDTSESVSKVPLLGDLPVLGFLFRNKSQTYTKSNLFVFLRPTVLHGPQQTAAVTQERYGRVYDLISGKKDLGDTDAVTPSANVPPVSTLYNPEVKTLPSLFGGDHSPTMMSNAPPAVAPSPIPPDAAANEELPWLRNQKPAAGAGPPQAASASSLYGPPWLVQQ
jgi:general secretion pathway protein D